MAHVITLPTAEPATTHNEHHGQPPFAAPMLILFGVFVFWLLISNMIQILLMPLIMIGQNIQGKHSEARAEHDLEVNVKAELEIEVVLHHLEYQNDLLIQLIKGLKLEIEGDRRPPS